MIRISDLKLKLVSYGPRAEIGGWEIGPDVFIALEGVGTFRGITAEERLKELGETVEEWRRKALKIHRESTRRGHASLTTSFTLQFEVPRCSRAASLLLIAPPFASYLQESQRRRKVEKNDYFIPPKLEGSETLKKIFLRALERAWESYERLIELGIPLEDARYVLPLASGTSLFVSGSLETFIGLIRASERSDKQYYPEELVRLGELVKELAMKVAPALTSARLSFHSPLPSYPYPNPYKPEDPLMENLVKECREPLEPVMLHIKAPKELKDEIRALLNNPEAASSLNPLIHATFLEPLSLVAYHQSIRHRTVPTAVEPIYNALQRAKRNHERNIIKPPSIKRGEHTERIFADAAEFLLESYQTLLEEGANPSDSLYLAPQATLIYVARTYNAFNLLWPQGYVATRTCSYAQWEERSIAYTIWRKIERRASWLSKLMGEKCKHLGYCPEKEWCQIIRKYRPDYDDEKHRKMLS